MLAVITVSYALAMPWSPQVVKTPQNQNRLSPRRQNGGSNKAQNVGNKQGNIHAQAQPLLADEDSIPDSLLHPRWKIQRTMPVTYDDLDQSALDLKRPDGLKYEVTYNDSLNVYDARGIYEVEREKLAQRLLSGQER